MHRFQPLEPENDDHGYANYLPSSPYQTSPLNVKFYDGQAAGLECGFFQCHANQASCSQLWPLVCICDEGSVLLYRTRSNSVGLECSTELELCAYVEVPCHRNADILYLTISELAGCERLMAVTTDGYFYCYKTSELWDKIKERKEGPAALIPKTDGEFGFPVSTEQVWGISAHPTLPLIAVSSNLRQVTVYTFLANGEPHTRLHYCDLPGNIPHVEIVPLENTANLGLAVTKENDKVHQYHKLIIYFSGIKLEHNDEDPHQEVDGKRSERGFAGYWILSATETFSQTGLWELESLSRGMISTRESAWLVKNLSRESLLRVHSKADLLGTNSGQIRKNRTWGGTFDGILEREGDPSLRADSSKHNTTMDDAVARYLTSAEKSNLDRSLTLFGLDTQLYLCEPHGLRWLAAATGRTLFPEGHLPVPEREVLACSFTMWTWMEDISLLGVVSRSGVATFLRLTRFEDETVGFRPEFAISRDDHILGICSMPIRSFEPIKKPESSQEFPVLVDHCGISVKTSKTSGECLNPDIGTTKKYHVIIYLEGGQTTTLMIEDE